MWGALNESNESIRLLIPKDRHCPSPNVHTSHPKCDISNCVDSVDSMHIGTQGLALFPN